MNIEAHLLIRQCAQIWLETEPAQCESAWLGKAGENYRQLQSLQLWKQGLMSRDRDLLEIAIKRVLANSRDWGAHLVLLLYKRIYRGNYLDSAPSWFQKIFSELTQTRGQHLEILPPIKNLKVTILITTYNRLETLKRAIQCVLAQTYSDWGLIIGDDCSADGTTNYCQELVQKYPQVRYVRNKKNRGFSQTMDSIYHMADTDLVVHCCDDDWMEPQYLKHTIGFFKAHPWVAMVSGGFQILQEDGTPLLQHGPYYPEATVVDNQLELQRSSLICPVGPLCLQRKSILKELARFDTMCCKQGEQYAIWDYMSTVKLLSLFEVGYIPELVAGMTSSPTTNSAKMDKIADLLALIAEIYKGYDSLYGKGSFPYFLAEQFVSLRGYEIQEAFQHILENSETAEQLKQAVATKQASWQKYVGVRQELPLCCNKEAPILVNVANPYGMN